MSLSLAAIGNHLWQSTLFAAAAALLAFALRNQRANVRYCLWLAASLKFLIPFALLVSLGDQVPWKPAPLDTSPNAAPRLSVVIGEIDQFTQPVAAHRRATEPVAPRRFPFIVLAVWFGGFLITGGIWVRRWRAVRAIMRDAQPLALEVPIPVRSSPARLEPGVFGLWNPILLVPENLTARLTPEQLRAVLLHELCHVRRRDNLAAALHMLVEAAFWFHPVVYWLEERLVAERERACDEEVLRLTGEPTPYAEGILNVAKVYLESPIVCFSGVTGADLKTRIEEIMLNRIAPALTTGKKLLLTAAALAAIVLPISLGLLRAQSSAPLAFEVASVKPNNSTEMRGIGMEFLPGGRLSLKGLPAFIIVAVAYGVPFQGSTPISGFPEWAKAERFDVEATAAPGAVPLNLSVKEREAKMRLMLQTLLTDRFQLKVRHETREAPVYELVIGKNGPKMPKAKIEEKDCVNKPADGAAPCHAICCGQGRGIHTTAADMEDLTKFLGNFSDRPILNKTNLPGLFEMEAPGWIPMNSTPRPPDANPNPNPNPAGREDLSDPNRPTIYGVLDMLGLKLEPRKAPIDFIIVDHMQRPTAN